jgi:hypothetical protein
MLPIPTTSRFLPAGLLNGVVANGRADDWSGGALMPTADVSTTLRRRRRANHLTRHPPGVSSPAMRFPIKITENFILEPVLHTFGVKNDTSFVEIEGGQLAVNMGRWFRESLPLDKVSLLAPSDWPWWAGLGVKLHHHGVGVVGSTEGVVNIRFTDPQKVHAGLVVDCTQLWVSLEDRDGFLHALSEACNLPVSGHTDF